VQIKIRKRMHRGVGKKRKGKKREDFLAPRIV